MIYDIWGFLSSAPHWLVYVGALAGFLFGGYWISGIGKQLKELIQTIETLDTMRSDLTGHINATINHLEDTKKLNSLEKWQTCDIQHCIHLQQLFNRMDKIGERLDQFDRRAEETRINTTTSLQALTDGQKELGRELGRELGDLAKTIINVLAEDLKRREK